MTLTFEELESLSRLMAEFRAVAYSFEPNQPIADEQPQERPFLSLKRIEWE